MGTVSTIGVPSTSIATRPSNNFAATLSGFSLFAIVEKIEKGASSINCSIYLTQELASVLILFNRCLISSIIFGLAKPFIYAMQISVFVRTLIPQIQT
jgi:hypothetical protein